jgi:hypothetical protein
MAKAKAFRRCVRCVAVRKKKKKVSHGGTESTAQNGEVREMAKVKVSGRCGRCVAVRKKKKKVSHGGTASTAWNREGPGDGESKSLQALCSLCRCEKKREEGVSRRHGVHSAEWRGRAMRRKQKPSGAVFAVSL